MPPKGWRKNAEGKFPQNNKDMEFVSIDEILFPKSVIQKLAKKVTVTEEDNMIISKDALTALQRSATVFVSHLNFHANLIAKDADRKGLNASDILKALDKISFGGFKDEVTKMLAAFESNIEARKKQKAEAKEAEAKTAEHNSEEGPAAKKLKDNVENSIDVTPSTVAKDDEADEDVDEDDTEVNTVNEEEDDDDAEEDEDESLDHRSQNPIALLNKEAQELEGDQHEDDTKVASENEDENEDDE